MSPDRAAAGRAVPAGTVAGAASFFGGFERCPQRVAFEVSESEHAGATRTLTYGELDRRSRAWVAGLRAMGVAPGDRVAFFGESSAALLTAVVGNLRGGFVHVPINTRYQSAEIGHILEDSEPAVLVAQAGSLACQTADEVDCPALRISLDGRATGALELEAMLAEHATDVAPEPPAADALAMLIYTSGTTGRSKGVALSHGALVANLGATTDLWRWSEADRLVLALPLFHVHGLGLGVLGTLLKCMTTQVLPGFSASAVVDGIARGGTIFMGVPTMHGRLLAHLDAHPEDAARLARARLFTSGSAALPAKVHERFEALTGTRILERYGMSETGFTLSNPHDGERRAGTVGFPVPGYEVELRGDDGGPVADGDAGELHVRGNGLLSGYWRRSDATREAFTEDGFFRTGDVATRDPDGYFRIVGRKSVDIIKSGGFKISAREIEDVLEAHPDIAEAAVIGVPDDEWGEAIAAAVVLAQGTAPRSDAQLGDELAAWVGTRLAAFKKPRRVRALEALPRNALGKLQKHRLRPMLMG